MLVVVTVWDGPDAEVTKLLSVENTTYIIFHSLVAIQNYSFAYR